MAKNYKQIDLVDLIGENEALIKELKVAREASSLTAELVARQFANLDIILKELDQRARNEKALRKDMTQARMAAEAANIAKSEFLANMSHEIRTPMNGIIGMTELVLSTELNDTQRHYLEMLRSSANRLLRVINDILDFSRVEAGKLEFDPVVFNLHEALQNAVNMFRPSAEKKGLAISVNIDEDVPTEIYFDSNRLLQIIINLVNNAIKFTNQGSVTLEVRALQKTQEDGCLIRFTVIDTGIGVAEEKREQIFESFRQADSSITRKYGGTGLGLAISCQLAKLMGSRIEMKSDKGRGSAFWFDCLLPTGPPEFQETTLPSQKRLEDVCSLDERHQLSILLAEDEPINQALVIVLLENLGLSVTSVNNGQEAVDEIVMNRYHLVLMDLQMPEVDGFEATRQIRLLEGSKGNTPIIALTAHAMQKDREKCLQAGMNDFLSKPINSEQLNLMVCKHLLPAIQQNREISNRP